ncbi:MAG: RES family NAD+ phosphorylase [Pirellulaceae bacterium]
MSLMCSNCAKDQILKEFILSRSSRIPRCEICGSDDANALDADDPGLRSLVRALIRLHYSEWEYNPHWGGGGLEGLLFAENEITNYSPHWDEELYEDLILCFVEKGYEDYDKGISLFAGYDADGQQLPLLRSLKSDLSPKLEKLKKRLHTTNHFLLEKEVDALLRPHISNLLTDLASGTVMYRARIGYDRKAMPLMSWGDEWHFRPYSAGQLGAPPPPLARSGRLNRPGVSFLYLGTNEETAICEVRPHPGHYVSVGGFESMRTIQAADLTKVSILDYYTSDMLLDQYLLLKSIDSLLSLPVVPEDREKYSLTQFLSDAFRRLACEGVMYRSSVASGSNLAVFDTSSFKYVEKSAKAVQVSNLTYEYSAVSRMDRPEEEYLIAGDGNPI